jgi:hypothetical protein
MHKLWLLAGLTVLCACDTSDATRAQSATVESDAAKPDAAKAPSEHAWKLTPPDENGRRWLDILPEDSERLQRFRDAPEWEIGFYTTSCFGTCPVFEVMLDYAGNFYYDGQGYVMLADKFETTIDASAVESLYHELLNIGFLRLRDSYQHGGDGCHGVFTDHPSTRMRLTIPEENKPVDWYQGCAISGPAFETLRAIERAIGSFPPIQRLTGTGRAACSHDTGLEAQVFETDDTQLTLELLDASGKSTGLMKIQERGDATRINKQEVLTVLDCEGRELMRTNRVRRHTCGLAVYPMDDSMFTWPGVDLNLFGALIGIEDDPYGAEYNVRLLSRDTEATLRARSADRCKI